MDDRYDLLPLQIIVTIIALVLFVDEIGMVFPELATTFPAGWLLGDLSAFHIEPFHHWMLGPILLVFVWFILPLIKMRDRQR